MNTLKRVFKYIASGFLVLLVTLCIYTFVATDIMKKDYVNILGYTYFVVASGSMSGTIEVNDIIFVKLTDKVNVNDVVTFKSREGAIITHRLISVDDSRYVTKGDANNVADEPIDQDQIIGKVKLTVSPSFILKSIAVFLIIFIFLALINFDKIVKKYIVKENPFEGGLPKDLFTNPKKKDEEPSTGLTVTIAFDEMEKLKKKHEEELEKKDTVEVMDFDDDFIEEVTPRKKNSKEVQENELIEVIISILKCKANVMQKSRINKKWLTKYQYVYKLALLTSNGDVDGLNNEINNPPFKEIYDYDLDKVGLTESIRNKIYDMPIHTFYRILTYAILYNDDELFDGVYKILKYKAMIDKDNYFKLVKKSDTYSNKRLDALISFMKKVSNKFDNKNVFELEKIDRMLKIRNY